jgi:hypothetical protein
MIYPVIYLPQEAAIFVAFDRAAAKAFAECVDDENQCEITEITECALIDNYGFPCGRSDAGFLFPWLADVDADMQAWLLAH